MKTPETLKEKAGKINLNIINLIILLCTIGIFMLYSAAGGSFKPWAHSQILKFLFGSSLMVFVAFLDPKILLKYAYTSYGIALFLLILVHIFGLVGMGAQRWIGIGPLRLQPSEFMKVSLILTLSCYYHRLSLEETRRIRFLIPPLILIGLPALLVLKQPDLGTTLLLVMIGVAIIFASGSRLWYFGVAFVGALASLPFAWGALHGYQKKRILTFLNPENDPLGSGYHILQSKIALGSGGVFGKGFLKGSQSYLNFLPEKQTDFIFTMFCEEFGFLGALVLLTLYGLLLFKSLKVSIQCQSIFCRLMSFGVCASLFIYAFINISMVIGLVPVVGIPLPFVSYGGTSLITLLVSFGLVLNADLNQNNKIPRYG